MIQQVHFTLPAYSRGCHLVTKEIVSQLPELPDAGLLHVFIAHTSAALSLNENADPSVRHDLEMALNHLAPEHASYYTHTLEGPDDMPAHIKTSLIGPSVSIPITNGELHLGTWQGIYLCEFRNASHRRNLTVTIFG